jgi:hypothetical protein
MAYLLVALVTILAVELLLRLPLLAEVRNLSALLQKVTRIVSSKRISDHWKEKVLLVYARNLAILTLKLAAVLLGTGLAVVVGSIALDWIVKSQVSTVEYLMTPQGIGLATIVSILYFVLRRRLVGLFHA